MTAATMRMLLELSKSELSRHHQCYRRSAKMAARSDAELSDLATFLAVREFETISSLERYLARDQHRAALEVFVRLGGGFPFEVAEWPAAPDLARLIDSAVGTDDQLEQLCERIELYAVSGELRQALDALRTIVTVRRRRLTAALHELHSTTP